LQYFCQWRVEPTKIGGDYSQVTIDVIRMIDNDFHYPLLYKAPGGSGLQIPHKRIGVTMLRRACGVLLLTALSVVMGLAQQPTGYLDVFIVKVKPEKRAEFDLVNKKIAEANRRHQGDTWLAYETAYGEGNTVVFSSARASYLDAEKSYDVFKGALGKAYGEAGAKALYQEFNSTLESSRSELRRRRWDLSYNAPADSAAYFQAVGNARWIRSAIVRARPGHQLELEALLKDINAAAQKSNQPGMRWVSQVVEGGNPLTYYVSRLLTSIGEMDKTPTLREILGDEGYDKFLKTNAEAVAGSEYVIYQILPEISNPPAEVTAVAPDYWNPRPKAAATPKPKAADAAKPAAQ